MLYFPAEWHQQYGVQLTWPHKNTDWHWILEEIHEFYLKLSVTIAQFEHVIIAADNLTLAEKIKAELPDTKHPISIFIAPSNDTWARDHGPIFVANHNNLIICDFQFNGWGNKFPWTKDNQITNRLFKQRAYPCKNIRTIPIVLEGGSIESDGQGTLLTTSKCLLNPNRNTNLNKHELEQALRNHLGVSKILWLDHGYLEGDDTDAHIDTLARLCPNNVLIYQGCQDANDNHFNELKAMADELKHFTNADDQPFSLYELPLPQATYDQNDEGVMHRLPATYANFLIINGAVLVPIYNVPEDNQAIAIMKEAMPEHQIIGIDCSLLIRQNGSLHCITMQIPDMSAALYSDSNLAPPNIDQELS